MEKTAFSAITALSYNDTVERICENNRTMHFFAAANSENGFVSFFDDVFGKDDIERLYILGGGPGSGKSTMMKKVGALSEKEGLTTEYIHCSSSPCSLDGVIVREKKIAVIDGTSPHIYVPRAAGVREINIDPGAAWDTDALFSRREKIFSLTDAKKSEYRKAYIYLRAAGLLAKEMRDMTRPYILEEKLENNVGNIFHNSLAKNTGSGECHVRIQRAVSGEGNIYFESLSRIAQKTYLVEDYRGIGHIYIGKLISNAQKAGVEYTVSYNPETPSLADGIFFNASGVAFTMYAKEGNFDKKINCERFINKVAASDMRQKYIFAAKSRSALLSESYGALKSAAALHDRIEKEYAPCTDFSVTQRICDDLCTKIFG